MESKYNERLFAIRKRSGLSQEQVAFEAGITTSYYGQIERGTANPSLKLIEKICDVLKVPLSDLFCASYTEPQTSDDLSQQILYQLGSKSDESKEIILSIIKQINKLEKLAKNPPPND